MNEAHELYENLHQALTVVARSTKESPDKRQDTNFIVCCIAELIKGGFMWYSKDWVPKVQQLITKYSEEG